MAMPLGATAATWAKAKALHIQNAAFNLTGLDTHFSRLSGPISIEQRIKYAKISFYRLILNQRWKPPEKPSHRIYCSWSGLETEDETDGSQEHVLPPERWDVFGLGQAMVDFSGMVDDKFLEKLELQKGIRKVVNHEERGKVLQAMDGCSFKAAAGGSLSNTLVALARLGMGSNGELALNVAMTGTVGSDPLGDFYRAKLQRANVNFLSTPVKDGTTGTVIVLTTPDAQRTMLSYQGYLWEFPETIEAIAKACEAAHRNGILVAITASDVSCVTRHRKKFWDIIVHHADIVFANSDEARALCGFSSSASPALAAEHISHYSPLVSVTDGIRGSYIAVKGEVIYIPPSQCIPVDTCGAGDAYAAGILYGILRGSSNLKGIGNLAARVAAVVVGQQGTRLRKDDAFEIAEIFSHSLSTENQHMDMHSCTEQDQISSI